uniref:Uncharacterized protein n=1 Tax=Streptomyces sp. NBC_00180 TaxID=2903632 RepID=A0AAU1IAY4_9ACTN
METWSDADARELVILLDYCGSGPVQATVKDLARVYNTTEKAFMEWLASILLNSTHPAVMDASKDVITTELDGWSPDDWSGWLRAVCIQAGYPMTANLPSGQGAFPGPVSPQQQTQGTGYVWTLDPAPPPAPAGHTATTAVYQNQAQDEAQGGDESDDSALLGCALNPQLQALTFDALAAHLAQWGFTRERVQHSLARIAYNSKVNLQGLDWNQAWRAIAANEQALSLEAMVDACLAQRLHLYTALANISGTAHVQQIDVANYIITLARHRLNRTYTDPDTAYFDLQRTVVPQPPPNPTRKRQRSQPDDYAPWLLSAALSTDSLREIAQQAEPAGAPTTEAGIEGAIRVLGGKLGLQGTAQEIRQQLQAMEHNGTLQNPNLYTPAAAPPLNAQHALNSLTPVQQWLLSAALSTDNFREIAQQAPPAGAPTTTAGIQKAIHGLGSRFGLQGTAQKIRQQLQAMKHNGTLQNPNLYTPAAAPPPNAQQVQHALNSLTPMQQWLLSAALSDDYLREIAQQAGPAGAPPATAGIQEAIHGLGSRFGLQGTAQEIRQQLQAMEHNGTLQNPNLYTPAAAPPLNAQHALNSLTPVQQWLLSAALSTDNFREIAQQAGPAGAPPTTAGIQEAIHGLGSRFGLQGTAQEIRQQLQAMEHNGTLQNPNLYIPAAAPPPTGRRPLTARPARQHAQHGLGSLNPMQQWLLSAALSDDYLREIADTAANMENRAAISKNGIAKAIAGLGKKLGLAGTAGEIREQLRQMEVQGILRDPGTYRRQA